jgi:methionyl-tRNA formyltransferase
MKIVFMGTPQAAVPTLEKILLGGHDVAAVYTQPDRPSGRGNKIVFSPVKSFALQNDLAVLQPQRVRTDEAIQTFRSHNADIVVVVAYGRILPADFLNAFTHGAINVHFSLLPKYRGAAPVNWAIAHGEKETGVTTMQMDESLDTGAILLQRLTKIGIDETAVELMIRLSILGSEMLSETLEKLADLEPVAQNDERATYASILKKEDGLIDWNLNANDIRNRVRGFQPFPTAFSYYKEQRLTLWRSTEVGNEIDENGPPGEILDVEGGDLIVRCGGKTALSVEELQFEGKRRMTTRDFLNGVKLSKGEILGK